MPCDDHSVSLDWCRNCAENDEAAEKHAACVAGLEAEVSRLRDGLRRELDDVLDLDPEYFTQGGDAMSHLYSRLLCLLANEARPRAALAKLRAEIARTAIYERISR